MRYSVVRASPYTADQLFMLVGDVKRYPEFVPWISSLRVWGHRGVNETTDCLDAEAGVGFAFLKERFSTRVTRDAAARSINVQLIRGPFRRLTNRWRFKAEPTGAKIEFEIDFEFKSRLLDRLLTANFDRAVVRLMECFEDRARALYGLPPVAVAVGSAVTTLPSSH